MIIFARNFADSQKMLESRSGAAYNQVDEQALPDSRPVSSKCDGDASSVEIGAWPIDHLVIIQELVAPSVFQELVSWQRISDSKSGCRN